MFLSEQTKCYILICVIGGLFFKKQQMLIIILIVEGIDQLPTSLSLQLYVTPSNYQITLSLFIRVIFVEFDCQVS